MIRCSYATTIFNEKSLSIFVTNILCWSLSSNMKNIYNM